MKIENNAIVELDKEDEKHLFIPKDVKAIDCAEPYGFFGELESIEVEEGNSVFCLKNNCLMDRDGKLYFATQGATIPADGSVKSIAAFAFNMVERLKGEVHIPEGVEEIGVRVFNGNGIEKLYIPASAKKIYEGFFLQKLDTHPQIIVDENNLYYYTKGGCLIERETMSVVAVFGDEIIIPEGVKRIGAGTICFYAFKKIVFPASLEEIDNVNFAMIGSPELLVPKNSYAEKYIKEQKVPYSYTK